MHSQVQATYLMSIVFSISNIVNVKHGLHVWAGAGDTADNGGDTDVPLASDRTLLQVHILDDLQTVCCVKLWCINRIGTLSFILAGTGQF